MATVALSGIITPTNVVTATSTTTLTNKTLTGAVMNGTLGATTPSTVVATTVKASTTMSVGGATPSASGSGITFPATQSASTDANTLDDYEEGTWTPNMASLVNLTGTPTYQSAKYTKFGNKCFFEAGITGLSVTVANTRTSFQIDYPVTAISAYAVSGTAFSSNASGLGGFAAGSTTVTSIYWETGTIIPSGAQAFQIGAWITTA